MDLAFPLVNIASPVNWLHPLNAGLTGWWKALAQNSFGGTRHFNLLGGRSHGTMTGMSLGRSATSGWNVTDRRGGQGHISYDGTNDYISIGTPGIAMASGDVGAFGAWIRVTGTGPTVVTSVLAEGQGSLGDTGTFYGLTRGTVAGTDNIWAANLSGALEDRVGATYTIDTWIHWFWVHDAGVLSLYKNGLLAGSIASGTTSTISNSFRLGRNGNSIYFLGAMDDVRFYNRALAAPEVLELYRESSNPASALLRYIPRTRRAPPAFSPPPYHRPLRIWRAVA